MGRKYKTDEIEWSVDFGDNLKKIIYANDFSLTEVARRLGITNAMLSRYISGAATPSVYKVCQIADVIGCDINDLVKLEY